MSYVSLTADQEKALVEARNTQFTGMDQSALLRFADVVVGLAAGDVSNLQEQIDGLYNDADDASAAISNLNAWAIALANKLNADAGVTDTNYDTNPQA